MACCPRVSNRRKRLVLTPLARRHVSALRQPLYTSTEKEFAVEWAQFVIHWLCR